MANRPVCYKISHFAGITGNSLQKIFISATVLSFKTIPIILVILRKTIIFAHSDA